MSYHVTFGEHQRILNVKKDDLVDTVKRVFQLRISSNEILHFKIWNDDWKDWVDTDIENVPSSCKLKISVIENVRTSPVLEALDALYGLDKSLPGQSDFGHSGSSGLNSSAQSNISFEDDVLEIGIPSASQYLPNAMSSKMTSTDVSQPKASYPRKWPQSYQLPTIPKNIEALTVLGRRERSIVIEILYHDMAQYTMYPKAEQYTEVVQKLLEAFPHWGDKSPIGKPWDTLRQKLIDKFKNERSRHYPSVTLTPKKRKRPDTYSKHKVACIQDGEDKETIERHVLWLQQEYNKLKPNRCRMQQLMDLTYPIRDFSNKRIEDCFKESPFLKEPEQLVREIFRSQNIDMVQVAISNLPKLPTDFATKCNVSSYNNCK